MQSNASFSFLKSVGWSQSTVAGWLVHSLTNTEDPGSTPGGGKKAKNLNLHRDEKGGVLYTFHVHGTEDDYHQRGLIHPG